MKKYASRSAQYPLAAEFAFSSNEWVVDSVDQVKKTFGATVANSTDPLEPGLTAATGVVFDCIPMPVGAVIIGGELIVETAYVGAGAAAVLNVGIAGSTSALIAADDLDAAVAGARTALTLDCPAALQRRPEHPADDFRLGCYGHSGQGPNSCPVHDRRAYL